MTKCRVCWNEHSGSCASFFSSQSRATKKPSVEEVVKTAPRAKRAAPAQASSVKHPLKHDMKALGKRGGLVGGVVRAARLSPERRREIAQAAARARWAAT